MPESGTAALAEGALRKSYLWKKIFDLPDGSRGSVDLQRAIEEPGKPQSRDCIQKQSAQNAALYEAIFNWVPRNESRNSDDSLDDGHILPTWDGALQSPKPNLWLKGDLSAPMPFEAEFWKNSRHAGIAATKLNRIKGFIVATPINWTRGENNRFEFPSSLVVDGNMHSNDAIIDEDNHQSGKRTG